MTRRGVGVALVVPFVLAAIVAAQAASQPRAAAETLNLQASTAPLASGRAARRSGTLDLQADIRFVSEPSICPPGTPEDVVCHTRRTLEPGVVKGLGKVSEDYTYKTTFTGCSAETAKALAYPVKLTVAQKGSLDLVVEEYPGCLPRERVPGASPLAFTVTGGTSVFAGASGSGTLTRVAGPPGESVLGTDTWTGTVVVPREIKLDLTAPTFAGAVSKTVRAPKGTKSAKVTYKVTATDDVDGPVSPSCRPKSGSRFKVGKTIVRCQAIDSSGNTAAASFTVTVKRRRS